jgi:hypothetical protein
MTCADKSNHAIWKAHPDLRAQLAAKVLQETVVHQDRQEVQEPLEILVDLQALQVFLVHQGQQELPVQVAVQGDLGLVVPRVPLVRQGFKERQVWRAHRGQLATQGQKLRWVTRAKRERKAMLVTLGQLDQLDCQGRQVLQVMEELMGDLVLQVHQALQENMAREGTVCSKWIMKPTV